MAGDPSNGGMILKWGAWSNFTDYVLDEALSGEAMKLFVIDKIKKKLIFFHKNKKKYLVPKCRQLLCKALVQSLFDCY